jgi:hypothetical protein
MLDHQQLLLKISEERARGRVIIEDWLNAEIQRPSCGCLVSWRWDWWQPNGGGIYPDSVMVTGVSCCDEHYRNLEHAIELQADYTAMLHDRLRFLRNQSNLDTASAGL